MCDYVYGYFIGDRMEKWHVWKCGFFSFVCFSIRFFMCKKVIGCLRWNWCWAVNWPIYDRHCGVVVFNSGYFDARKGCPMSISIFLWFTLNLRVSKVSQQLDWSIFLQEINESNQKRPKIFRKLTPNSFQQYKFHLRFQIPTIR